MSRSPDQNQTEKPQESLDLRGQSPVWSILRIQRSLREMAAGGLLEVQATDPGLPELLATVFAKRGDLLQEQKSFGGFFRLLIRRGGEVIPSRDENPSQNRRKNMSQPLSEIPQAAGSVDARGSACPGPLLEAKKAIASVKVGEVLEVLSNDPGTKDDIPVWANKVGHEYLGYAAADGYERVFVRRQK